MSWTHQISVSKNKKLQVANSIWERTEYKTKNLYFSFEIARQIKSDSCGLVFGVNTFLALAFQTILTLIVVEILQFNPQKQFVIYGFYSFGIALLLLFIFVINGFRKGWRTYLEEIKKNGIWMETKEGIEEDGESKQLSLGGAIEATK